MTEAQIAKQQTIFENAHEAYVKSLYSYAYFKVHDKTTSEDLVQDAFLKAWSYLIKGGKIETMKAFLYHILNNLIVDQYRKRKAVSLDALLENGFEPSDTDSSKLYNDIDGKSVLNLITKLPQKYQHVMSLRYIHGLTLTEISNQTGQSENTIAVQIHRGIEKLRQLQQKI